MVNTLYKTAKGESSKKSHIPIKVNWLKKKIVRFARQLAIKGRIFDFRELLCMGKNLGGCIHHPDN